MQPARNRSRADGKWRLGGESHRARGVIYFGGQTHSAVERALRVLGFAEHQMRRLVSDAAIRLPVDALARAVADDRAAGLRPFCVVANAGATNTGAIGPLPAPGAFCRRERLWLRVDGPYGAAAVLCDEGRALLAGLGEADSLAPDPHSGCSSPSRLAASSCARTAPWSRPSASCPTISTTCTATLERTSAAAASS